MKGYFNSFFHPRPPPLHSRRLQSPSRPGTFLHRFLEVLAGSGVSPPLESSPPSILHHGRGYVLKIPILVVVYPSQVVFVVFLAYACGSWF